MDVKTLADKMQAEGRSLKVVKKGVMNKILCQNCYAILGEKNRDKIRYSPVEAFDLVQALDDDHVLITLQCPKCGCLVQVKT